MHSGVERAIKSDAAINLKVLRGIRDDVAAPARVRADIGIKLLSLAGHIAPRTRDEGPQKAISEMSHGELLEYINRNQAAIDKAEAELMNLAKDVSLGAGVTVDVLMNLAKDVSPGAGVTVDVPKHTAKPAKPLNYLD